MYQIFKSKFFSKIRIKRVIPLFFIFQVLLLSQINAETQSITLSRIILGSSDHPSSEDGAQTVEVVGLKIEEKGQLEKILEDKFIGHPLQTETINKIKCAIFDFYKSKGYPLVQVLSPPQRISNGTLYLQVVESSLGDISIYGVNCAYKEYRVEGAT